jgi:hypothetical protein
MNTMRQANRSAIALIAALATAGCATDEYGNSRPYTNAEKGAMMGAIGGAVAGAAINHKNRGKGALIGAVAVAWRVARWATTWIHSRKTCRKCWRQK